VVSFRVHARTAPITALDDVVLAIRGKATAAPCPGKINVLWVISRPNEVSVDELRQFDLVYAASEKWARKMSADTGVRISPLLQATDPRVFVPPIGPQANNDEDIVFVGQARADGPRQIVMDAFEAGFHPKIWGTRWDKYLSSELVAGPYFPNELLGDLYGHSRIVLADHYEAMAKEGFIANRLFDAVCAGARVVSDAVDGVDEIFGGVVQTYRDVADLGRLLSPEATNIFPSDVRRMEIARRIAAEHSFQVRADRLIADVTELWLERRQK